MSCHCSAFADSGVQKTASSLPEDSDDGDDDYESTDTESNDEDSEEEEYDKEKDMAADEAQRLQDDAKDQEMLKVMSSHGYLPKDKFIRSNGDCMFDVLALFKRLGAFGDQPQHIRGFIARRDQMSMYVSAVFLFLISVSREIRHHIAATIDSWGPAYEKDFNGKLMAGEATLKQTLVNLLKEGTRDGWSVTPLPEALHRIFGVPFVIYSPAFLRSADKALFLKPSVPLPNYPPIRIAHVWHGKHYVPVFPKGNGPFSRDVVEEQENQRRIASKVHVDWKTLPDWLMQEFMKLSQASGKGKDEKKEEKRTPGDYCVPCGGEKESKGNKIVLCDECGMGMPSFSSLFTLWCLAGFESSPCAHS